MKDSACELAPQWMLYWAVTLTFNMSYPVLVLVSMYGLKTLTRSEKIFQGSLALAVFSSYIGLILRGEIPGMHCLGSALALRDEWFLIGPLSLSSLCCS